MSHRKAWKIRDYDQQETCDVCRRLIPVTKVGKDQHYKDYHPEHINPQPDPDHHLDPQPNQEAHGQEEPQPMQDDDDEQDEDVGMHVPVEDQFPPPLFRPNLPQHQDHQHPEPHMPPAEQPQPQHPEPQPAAPQLAHPPLTPDLYQVRPDSAYAEICAAVMRKRRLTQVDMDFVDLVYNKLHLSG